MAPPPSHRPPPRPAPRHSPRPKVRVRWGRVSVLVAAVVLTGVAGYLVASDHGGSPTAAGNNTPAASNKTTTTTTAPPPTTTTTAPPPTTTTTVDPGTLPQTAQLPAATTPQFNAQMDALWNGIVTNSVQTALPAFFPEAAYLQLKTIANPQGDFTQRLVGDYALDIGAAHALLGPGAAQAHLVSVNVDESYAHWVPPGVCSNSIGYFEVPNSRLVYEQNGQTSSFGIASMISWRGVWYVVHLGAVLRSSDQGVVEDPQSGPGTPTPSSTC